MHLKNCIKNTLGIKDHRIVHIDDSTENIVMTLDAMKHSNLPCGDCNERTNMVDRVRNECCFVHIPLWDISVILRYWPRRVNCPYCGIRREQLPWAANTGQITKQLSIDIPLWQKLLSVDVVAKTFGVHWKTFCCVVRAVVSYFLNLFTFELHLYIGIAKIVREKRHNHMQQTNDLEEKRLLWNRNTHKEETHRMYFETHYEQLRTSVVCVSLYMWAPCIKVICEYLSNALQVLFRFHLLLQLLDAVDTKSQEEVRELKKTNPGLLKGSKYVFQKNPENLTDMQRARFSRIEIQNMRINRTYLLKEEFKELYRYRSKARAAKFLTRWSRSAMYSQLLPLEKFVRLLRKPWVGSLAWVTLPLSNGTVEAM